MPVMPLLHQSRHHKGAEVMRDESGGEAEALRQHGHALLAPAQLLNQLAPVRISEGAES
jgi:hypothetical protein